MKMGEAPQAYCLHPAGFRLGFSAYLLVFNWRAFQMLFVLAKWRGRSFGFQIPRLRGNFFRCN
jgi:hypothetical protein